MRHLVLAVCVIGLTGSFAVAQTNRPLSPRGQAAAQVGGVWDTSGQFPTYRDGKWLEIDYGRPIRRGRTNLFGRGADYGTALLADTPIWRAGANKSTTLTTEVPLIVGGTRVEAGEYTLFIDLAEAGWTFVVSSFAAKANPQEEQGLWGSDGYETSKDVARAPMVFGKPPARVEQLTWFFADVSDEGGTIVVMWDDTLASVPFTVAR